MKTNITPKLRIPYCYVAILFLFVINIGQAQDSFTTYKGEVVNEANNDPLVFATLSVEGTNISTVTNSDGLFTLKVPNTIKDARIVVMYLGFTPKTFLLSSFNKERTKIGLSEVTTQLNEVMVQTNKNAKAIVKKALSNKGENYMNSPKRMMAFYRETIKKRRRNVSLAEAVITVNKESYDSFKSDKIALFKSRKSTDYSKLDTIALKLQGGPLNALYVDVMKYPDYFLNYSRYSSIYLVSFSSFFLASIIFSSKPASFYDSFFFSSEFLPAVVSFTLVPDSVVGFSSDDFCFAQKSA